MKQIVLKQGKALVEKVPDPSVESGKILVKVAYSCISQGTELSGMANSGQGKIEKLIETVKSKPEKVQKAIDKLKTEGLKATVQKVNNATKVSDALVPTGYSASGEVIKVGSDVKDIKVGDRVACAGAGIANHAEYISVPRNLVMKVPDGLDYDKASTVTLGGIALQGVRRGDFRLGEFVVVVGLGFIGQLTVQMLVASGCRVIATDFDKKRTELALKYGAEKVFNPAEFEKLEKEILKYTNGYGADGVIFTAATHSNEALSTAFKMCKKKGRVILVGVSGMKIDRGDIYSKELDFLISTSYGPGRYDELYEMKGQDYPYAYVRWTENRNMEEYLRLLSTSKINIDDMIEKVYPVEKASEAYEELFSAEQKPIIALFEYPNKKETSEKTFLYEPLAKKDKKIVNVAIIGAGGFAKGMHIPNLLKLKNKYHIYAICDVNSLNAAETAKKCGANIATTDYERILKNENVDMVMICTRHNLHAEYAIKALKAGKAVFVEKPMATNEKELDELVNTIKETKLPYMVGFNRRFSPFAKEIKGHLKNRINPMMISYRMNAGYIPLDHWVHTEEGGGRIIGEACHLIDLFNYFTEAEIETVSVDKITPKTEAISSTDNVSINIKYDDGSVANLIYTSLGNSKYPKENLEVYCDEKVYKMTDYMELEIVGGKILKTILKDPDKGHLKELEDFNDNFKNKNDRQTIPLKDIVQTTKTTLAIQR